MSTESQLTAYGVDLAYIHDVGFGGFAQDSAPGLLRLLNQAGIEKGLVVDLGCGSGIWAKRLVDAGYRVAGVDISPSMIALARARAPDASFRVQSFLKYTDRLISRESSDKLGFG